ncbi:shikimate kinase [Aquiluna sp. KACHI24]|uniref:shikimate kinase n=1 Tax=Aquiluna sp. KACHI24 TaxID=2968831 RepID=UPI0022035BF4|nr:shikimate kinase [Aquiluna sp. KACHI24]BDQ00307.1 shikimate kinase [Aquiluna sp. KACHI24]
MAGAIVLIGPMGSGKTTLGKKLAKELGLQFIDTDKQIAGEHGPITKLFEEKGEAYFRDLETSYLEAALEQPAVVATGGGAILRQRNQELISKHHVIFLDTSAEHVIGKVNMSKRPLIRDNPKRWQEIYDARLSTYQALAKQTVFTGGRPIKKLIQEIRDGLGI